MALNLPPDPYKILGVTKDSKLPEIRSAHRKLVLKCHPDKVQDAALKAIKQDEFQRVQQAYELLSDDNRRLQYDEQVKLFELRKEMGRGVPTARSNPFEYEVRDAEPRPSTYSRPKPAPPSQPHVYSHQPPPRSYEDVMYEEPLRTAKKSASYESTERRRPSTREQERERDSRKQSEDERIRAKWEKETKRSAHGEKKKSRDKEKRRGTEEKHSRTQPYVEDDSDDYRTLRREKSDKRRMEEEIRTRNEEAARLHAENTIRQAPLTPKWDAHKEFAGAYMQTARRKADEEFSPGPMRRAETFAGPETKTYNVRHVAPKSPHLSPSDDESPRRSSAARTTRRSSEAPPRSTRESSKKEHKRSPSARARDPYIVEPPSPPPVPTIKVPTLKTHNSAPPAGFSREKPIRSKTEYPRSSQDAPVPSLPRAQTFQNGERDRGKSRGGSRLKKSVEYAEGESDSDSPVYASPRHSHSPPPRRVAPEPTRYIIDNGRSVPISKHRSEMRDIDDEDYGKRDRSESPRGTRHSERPPLNRSGGSGSRQAPQRSHSQAYYTPEAPEPIILTARPKMPARETGHRSGSGRGGPYFGEVNFAPSYGAKDATYSPHAIPQEFRRGSDPTHHRDYATYTPRAGRDPVYAS